MLYARESPYPPYALSDKNVELHVFVQMWSCQKCGVSAPRPRKSRFPALSTPHFYVASEMAIIRWPNPLPRGTDATFSIPPRSSQVSLSTIVGACRRRLRRLAYDQWLHPSLPKKLNPHTTARGCRPSTSSSKGGCRHNPRPSPRLLEECPQDPSI